MTIQITKDIRIITDPLNYTVQERKINQQKDSKNYGEEYWANIPAPHCGNLERALVKILEYAILTDEEIRDIESLKTYIEECKYNIVQAIKESDCNA